MKEPKESAISFTARTVSESVTARLREEIVTGQLAPGERLSQDQLAERFGVSRIPVREALRQLSSEGLVDLPSHRGATVSQLSPEEIAELIAIAGTLEGAATTRGATRLSKAELEQMRKLLDAMRNIEDRPQEWYRLNVAFHMVLTRASGWTRLAKLVEETRQNIMRYVVQPDVHHSQVRVWHQQHCEIYMACEADDAARIAKLSSHHWRYSTEVLLERISPPAAIDAALAFAAPQSPDFREPTAQ
jgi:DNA-binding GntR family transcriptional regulator